MKVIGLDHVVLNSADIERSLAWYADVLGLEPMNVDAWRRGDVFFPSVRLNATTIIDIFPAERTGENVNHVCLVVEDADIDALAEQFPEGHRVDRNYGAQGYGASLYVHDPDGNTVELKTYPS
ncbi:MAG TPA: VOC family protein [Acidimicrobiia bacterium]|nr:VOC family protein [Acidimicrobiia bacterium]